MPAHRGEAAATDHRVTGPQGIKGQGRSKSDRGSAPAWGSQQNKREKT